MPRFSRPCFQLGPGPPRFQGTQCVELVAAAFWQPQKSLLLAHIQLEHPTATGPSQCQHAPTPRQVKSPNNSGLKLIHQEQPAKTENPMAEVSTGCGAVPEPEWQLQVLDSRTTASYWAITPYVLGRGLRLLTDMVRCSMISKGRPCCRHYMAFWACLTPQFELTNRDLLI
jgi:hypothetical protein